MHWPNSEGRRLVGPKLGTWAFKWPQWHILPFKEQVTVQMRLVCPHNAQKMLMKQTRIVYWKTWAAKHDGEESHGSWTDKHGNVMRKMFVEARLV